MRGEERQEREKDEALDFEPAFAAPALEDLEGVELEWEGEWEEDMLAEGLVWLCAGGRLRRTECSQDWKLQKAGNDRGSWKASRTGELVGLSVNAKKLVFEDAAKPVVYSIDHVM